MACTCGNNRFFARQQLWADIIVDGNGIYEETVEITDSETPYGPFVCTRCRKEYEGLPKKDRT